MTLTVQVKFRDDGEKQRFENIREIKESNDEYILIAEDGKEYPFFKTAIEKPSVITFTPIEIIPKSPEA